MNPEIFVCWFEICSYGQLGSLLSSNGIFLLPNGVLHYNSIETFIHGHVIWCLSFPSMHACYVESNKTSFRTTHKKGLSQ